MPWGGGGRDRSCAQLGCQGPFPEAEGKVGHRASPQPWGSVALPTPWLQMLWLPDPETIHFSCFQPPACGTLFGTAPGRNPMPFSLLPLQPPRPAPSSGPYLSSGSPPHPTFSETLVLESGPQPSAPSTRPPPPQHVEVLQPHPSPSRLPTPDPPGPGLSPLAPFQDDILRRSRRVWPLPHPVHWRTTGIRLPCPPLLSPQQVLAGVQVAAPPSLPDLAERPARSALPFPAGLLWFPSFARSAGFVRSGSV